MLGIPQTTGQGFRIYSPLAATADPHASPTTFQATTSASPSGDPPSSAQAEFTAIQLLKVMNRLVQPGTRALSYFMLCREMGAQAVDGMIRARVLDLRWTDPISREGWDPRIASMRFRESRVPPQSGMGVGTQRGAGSSGTMVNDPHEGSVHHGSNVASASRDPDPEAAGVHLPNTHLRPSVHTHDDDPNRVSMPIPLHHHLPTPQRATGRFDLTESPHTSALLGDDDDIMVALSDEEIVRETQRHWELQGAEEEEEIVGPKVLPTTPIMRFAMREVVQEYYDDDEERSVSEYASLSGPDEY